MSRGLSVSEFCWERSIAFATTRDPALCSPQPQEVDWIEPFCSSGPRPMLEHPDLAWEKQF